MVKTLSQLYLETRQALLKTEEPQRASLLARNLLCHATGLPQETLVAEGEHPVSEAVCRSLKAETARLLAGEPLAYLLGEWEFYGLKLYVDRNVLIPRDDTCAVTALAIKQCLFLDPTPRILDLCTGSGCIGLAVASRVTDARVTLVDISQSALAVAKKNITANHLSGRVSCFRADALEKPPAFLGKFDLIVSNPPYVTTREMECLPKSVRDYEPHLALHGGQDGLDFYRAILQNYAAALKPGGLVCLEFGMGQGDAVCALLSENGYAVLERVRDYGGIERAVAARYGRKEDRNGNEEGKL